MRTRIASTKAKAATSHEGEYYYLHEIRALASKRHSSTFQVGLARHHQDSQESKFVILENLVTELTFTSVVVREKHE